MKVHIYQNLRCECTSVLVYNEKDKEVWCPFNRCEFFNKKFHAPSFILVNNEEEKPEAIEGKKWQKRLNKAT